MRDGTFGTTGRCPPFETELAQALQSHSFEPVKVLQWRNTALDFTSIGALQASLAETPKQNGLTRAPIAEDILVLEHAARDDEIRFLANSRHAVERLWDVCQVPDYRKISPATHAELATTLYGFLMREGTIPTDWFARQVEEADRADGDIDTLSNRIAHIRTWTFAANRPDWLVDPEHWQGVARAVEDKLSDALHDRLTERFVDRRTSVLMRRLRENATLETNIGKTGEVVVEGHVIGRLDGFMFTPAASAAGSEAKALASAAQKALAGEIDARATRLAQAADGQLVLATDDTIRWLGQPVGKLIAAEETLKPRVRLIADEYLTGAPRDAVQARLDLWLRSHIERLLEPLFRLAAAEDIVGIARGLAFQLTEALGVLDRHRVAEEVKGLEQPARAILRKYGVRFGAYHVYMPALLKPAPRRLAMQLWGLKHGGSENKALDAIEQLAGSGRTSIAANEEIPKAFYRVAGYRVCGTRAVRVDILERLADLIRPALAWRSGGRESKPAGATEGFGFMVTGAMTSLAGCSGEDFASVLRSLGYRMERRPKSPEPPLAPLDGVQPSSRSVQDSLSDTALNGEGGAPASGSEHAAIAEVGPGTGESLEPTESGTADTPALAAAQAEAAATALNKPVASATAGPEVVASLIGAQAEGLSGDVAGSAPSFEAASNVQTAAEEFIEVWRPGRRDEHARKPRREGRPRHRRREGQPQAPHVAPTTASGVSAKIPSSIAPAGRSATETRIGPSVVRLARNEGVTRRATWSGRREAIAAAERRPATVRITIRRCVPNTSRAVGKTGTAANPTRIRHSRSSRRSKNDSRRATKNRAEGFCAWIANASTNGFGTRA